MIQKRKMAERAVCKWHGLGSFPLGESALPSLGPAKNAFSPYYVRFCNMEQAFSRVYLRSSLLMRGVRPLSFALSRAFTLLHHAHLFDTFGRNGYDVLCYFLSLSNWGQCVGEEFWHFLKTDMILSQVKSIRFRYFVFINTLSI